MATAEQMALVALQYCFSSLSSPPDDDSFCEQAPSCLMEIEVYLSDGSLVVHIFFGRVVISNHTHTH